MHLISIMQLLQNFSILTSKPYIAKWKKPNIKNVFSYFLSNFNQLVLLLLSCVHIARSLSSVKW